MDFMFQNEECMSGCESGWTLYLEHSSISQYDSYDREKEVANILVDEEQEDDDEDMSMVSDASSGPPHLHKEADSYVGSNNIGCFYHYAINNDDDKNSKKLRRNVQDLSSLQLDDTASSPLFSFNDNLENVLEHSQGYSSTHVVVRPPYEEQYDFFKSTQSGNQLQNNSWFEGNR